MSPKLAAIQVRRAQLIERAAREREDLDRALQVWVQPLGFLDRCIGAVRYVLSRPPLVAGAAALLVVLRPRGAFKWARRAFGLWQGYRWLAHKLTP